MLELRAEIDAGHPLTTATWERALRRELGEQGVADWRAMMAGGQPLPATDAFGACFQRVQKPLRRYDLGFEPKVLTEQLRIIRGLEPGSAAASAGLQNGDEILQPVAQDNLQGDQDGVLTLQISRQGRSFAVSYKPRGESVLAWQWELKPGADPSASCALAGR